MKLTIILIKYKAFTVEIISTMLVFLFVYAAVSKLLDHEAFLNALRNSSLIASYSNVVSWAVPVVELFFSILLVVPKLRRFGLLCSSFLMCTFTLYIAYMLSFTSHLPCSCGGILKNMPWKQHLVFNICFTVLGFCAWTITRTNKNFIAINRISRTPA